MLLRNVRHHTSILNEQKIRDDFDRFDRLYKK
jgi:hypothetical protein